MILIKGVKVLPVCEEGGGNEKFELKVAAQQYSQVTGTPYSHSDGNSILTVLSVRVMHYLHTLSM